jgi:5-hydroxyisourate hydrolase
MITTHVLDTTRGRPATGVAVVLERHVRGDEWRTLGYGETDNDGRLTTLVSSETPVTPGVYRLSFNTHRYFEAQGRVSFYPHIVIVFQTLPGETHYHVPLLVGPFGYTTYRGS